MIDLAGLVIGAVALGTVLSTMVQAVQILEKAKSQHKDLEYFEVMIKLQGIRLYFWAEAYQPLAARLRGDSFFEMTEQTISQSLQVMQQEIFQILELFQKHGLTSAFGSTTSLLISNPSKMLSQDLIVRSFNQPAPAYIPPRPKLKRSKRQKVFGKLHLKTAWAVNDSLALEEAVTRVTKLIDALEHNLTGLKARAKEAKSPKSRWRRFLGSIRRVTTGRKEQTTLPPSTTKALTPPRFSDESIIEVNPKDVVRI